MFGGIILLNVLGIGDNVCDIYLHSGIMYPGGQALNIAVYAAMLGAKSGYIGVFGTDAVADHVAVTLDKIGVDRSRCRRCTGENGYARVKLIDGDRVFMGSNRGGVLRQHPIQLEEDDETYISGFDLVHTSNNSYFDDQLPQLRKLPVKVSYDFSGRWVEEDRLEKVCPYIDFGFLSCGSVPQEQALKVCKRLHEKGCGVVVATMGSKGALLYDGKVCLFQPPDLVEAIDTLGAGDSFATGFLLEMLRMEKSSEKQWETDRKGAYLKALKAGAAFAAKSCMTQGAFGYGIPVPKSIADRLSEE